MVPEPTATRASASAVASRSRSTVSSSARGARAGRCSRPGRSAPSACSTRRPSTRAGGRIADHREPPARGPAPRPAPPRARRGCPRSRRLGSARPVSRPSSGSRNCAGQELAQACPEPSSSPETSAAGSRTACGRRRRRRRRHLSARVRLDRPASPATSCAAAGSDGCRPAATAASIAAPIGEVSTICGTATGRPVRSARIRAQSVLLAPPPSSRTAPIATPISRSRSSTSRIAKAQPSSTARARCAGPVGGAQAVKAAARRGDPFRRHGAGERGQEGDPVAAGRRASRPGHRAPARRAGETSRRTRRARRPKASPGSR